MARAAGKDPKNPAIYEAINRTMLGTCATLIVAEMDGWQESTGIFEEILTFEALHKPIYMLNPHTLTMIRREEQPDPSGIFENGFR
jgi:hypothetical protein